MMKILAFGIAVLFWTMGPSLHAGSGEAMLYGIVKQDEGAGVLMLERGKFKQIAKANELRPSSVKEDWTRRLLPLRPLLLKNDQLYFYLQDDSMFESGIYKKTLKSEAVSQLVIKGSELVSFSSVNEAGEVLAVGSNGDLFKIEIEDAMIKKMSVSGLSFASWGKEKNELVVVRQPEGGIELISFQNGKFKVQEVIAGGGIKRAFVSQDPEKYFFEKGWAVGVYNAVSRKFEKLNFETVTASAYDRETNTLFFFVANDHDGRILYTWKVSEGKPVKVDGGVFNDFIMPVTGVR